MADTAAIQVPAANGHTTRKPWYMSRKVWSAVAAALIPLLNEALGLNLSPEVVNKAMAGPLSLLGIEALLDFRSVGKVTA